jgi:DNA-directed RNA polymerase subunit RPC12/RpoP
MQKVFRCVQCQRGMRAVGSTGLGKQVERKAQCPYCKAKNVLTWPKGDNFRIQRIAAR